MLSVVLGAVVAGLIISPAFPGGILTTVPAMLIYHALIGVGEGAITAVLVSSLQTIQPTIMSGITLLKETTL